MKPRSYQELSNQLIREEFKKGNKKVLLHLATGAGKTFIFSRIIKSVAAKGNYVLMVVRSRHLVDQASQRLCREFVPHGVLMANYNRYRPHELIQICSIDTLRARKLKPKASMIIIDEAHQATSDTYKYFAAQYPDAFFLGVTATPFTTKSIEHIANKIISPITMQSLIDQRYLVNARYFSPFVPDLIDVKTMSAGDYNQGQLAEAMDKNEIIGDIVSTWIKRGEDRPSLVFAVNIQHSKSITESFCNAGIKAEHMDADTNLLERKKIIRRHENGETKIICNVGVLCTGIDIPWLSCIIMARPTKSYILYIQQAGRGTRPFNCKYDFLLLDHAGNINRHGFLTDPKEPTLKGKKIIEIKLKITTCKKCFGVYKSSLGSCPYCGFKKEIKSKLRQMITIDGELRELSQVSFNERIIYEIKKLKKQARNSGYKMGWVYYQLKMKYGQDIADKYFSEGRKPVWMS